ncbi:MAG: hypothetical protein ACRDYC_08370, partial [Acidimicrobiales bacterium]
MARRGLVWCLLITVGLAIAALAGTILSGNVPLLGLDLKGGVEVVLQPQGRVNSGTISQSVAIIDRRVNGLGVSNASVTQQGNDVVIELPGLKNSQSALKVLGQTAVLYFRPVDCTIPSYTKPSSTSAATAPTGAPSSSDCSSSDASSLVSTSVNQDSPTNSVLLPYYDHTVRYILGPADMKGNVVKNAIVVTSQAGAGYEVQVTFTTKGVVKFDTIASQRYPSY